MTEQQRNKLRLERDIVCYRAHGLLRGLLILDQVPPQHRGAAAAIVSEFDHIVAILDDESEREAA